MHRICIPHYFWVSIGQDFHLSRRNFAPHLLLVDESNLSFLVEDKLVSSVHWTLVAFYHIKPVPYQRELQNMYVVGISLRGICMGTGRV